MNPKTLEYISDTLRWFDEHKSETRSHEQQMEFLTTTVLNMMLAFQMMARDMEEVRTGKEVQSSRLYLPRGVRLRA